MMLVTQALPGEELDQARTPRGHPKKYLRAIYRAPKNVKTILPQSKIYL